jgi:hypothetical protein
MLAAAAASARDYKFRVVAEGLSRPVGIAVQDNKTLIFTQVPTPGVAGGSNGVFRLDLDKGEVTTLHLGEPEPLNVALDREGDIYWTCRTAGVILKQDDEGETTMFLGELEKPTVAATSISPKSPTRVFPRLATACRSPTAQRRRSSTWGSPSPPTSWSARTGRLTGPASPRE